MQLGTVSNPLGPRVDGTFEQLGGSNHTERLKVGYFDAHGSYTLRNGYLVTEITGIGGRDAVFRQFGGVHFLAGSPALLAIEGYHNLIRPSRPPTF